MILTAHMFLRVDVMLDEKITSKLNELSKDGWAVVSHCEYGNEYSFVLTKTIFERDKLFDNGFDNGADPEQDAGGN